MPTPNPEEQLRRKGALLNRLSVWRSQSRPSSPSPNASRLNPRRVSFSLGPSVVRPSPFRLPSHPPTEQRAENAESQYTHFTQEVSDSLHRLAATSPEVEITLAPFFNEGVADHKSFEPFTFGLSHDGTPVQLCRSLRTRNYIEFMGNNKIGFATRVMSRGSHAQIWYQNHQVYVQDTGSSAGTFLNGAVLSREPGSISSPHCLRDGDILQLGRNFVPTAERPETWSCVVARIQIKTNTGVTTHREGESRALLD